MTQILRTGTQIKSSALAFIDAQKSGIMTDDGEPIIELLDAVAIEIARSYVVQAYLKAINSIPGWLSIINDTTFKAQLADALGLSSTSLTIANQLGVPNNLPNDAEAILWFDLNNFAATFGTTRKAAVSAQGVQQLVLSTNSAFSLAAGATVLTSGGNPQKYQTTNDLVAVIPTFDPVNNFFFVLVNIAAVVAGSASNQRAKNINVVSPAIPGVTQTFNPNDVQGGIDIETNAQLLARLQFGAVNKNIATYAGLTAYLNAQIGNLNTVVVGAGDPLMTRAVAGAVDAYVIAETDQVVTSIVTPDPTTLAVVLPFQPVISVSSVMVGVTTLVLNTDYVVEDLTTTLLGTVQDRTRIRIINATYNTAQLSVTYVVNQAIPNLQGPFNGSDTTVQLPGGSVLVRASTKVLIDISCHIVSVANTGLTPTQIQSLLQTQLSTFYSAFIQAQTVAYADVNNQAVLVQSGGIPVISRLDNVQTKRDVGGTFGIVDLVMGKIEYARLGTLTFV